MPPINSVENTGVKNISDALVKAEEILHTNSDPKDARAEAKKNEQISDSDFTLVFNSRTVGWEFFGKSG